MNLEEVVKEEIPFHARIYPQYLPIMGSNLEKRMIILYKEDLQKEIDDNDNNDGEYDGEKPPIAVVQRALKTDHPNGEFETYEQFEGEIIDHMLFSIFIPAMEAVIDKKKWAIQNFKIFHIWNISLNNKPNILPWSAKFQPVAKKIELEIHSHEKDENEISQTRAVDFDLNIQDCDKCLSATIDDCKVMYSLFSNAIRVRLEIRPYNADGSPVRDVNGHVRAYYGVNGKYGKYLFGGDNKYEISENIAANGTLMIYPSALIFPRDRYFFGLDMSLNDDVGKFEVKEDIMVLHRRVAIDEQHYIVGKKGYIILTTIWACLCVDLEQGVCTCPGTAIGFDEENNDGGEDTNGESNNEDIGEDTKDESDNEDSVEGRMKRAKIRQSSCTSQEENDSGEGTIDESNNEDSVTLTKDESNNVALSSSTSHKTTSGVESGMQL